MQRSAPWVPEAKDNLKMADELDLLVCQIAYSQCLLPIQGGPHLATHSAPKTIWSSQSAMGAMERVYGNNKVSPSCKN